MNMVKGIIGRIIVEEFLVKGVYVIYLYGYFVEKLSDVYRGLELYLFEGIVDL